MHFLNRTDAALQLAEQLQDWKLTHPLVLGIPRGGMVLASVLADQIGAELDIVLSRKLPAPGQPELAMGAISEDGNIVWNEDVTQLLPLTLPEIEAVRDQEIAEIDRRRSLFRRHRPKAAIAGRSVIVTDDGIATGATMIAALQDLRHQQPRELIVAVPVAATSRLEEVRRWCDRAVCLFDTEEFFAVGQFYHDFRPVEDGEVVMLLEKAVAAKTGRS